MDRPPAPVLHDYQAEVAAGAVWVLGDPVIAVIVLIEDGDSLFIENVAVEPARQGTGIGRQLMEFAEQEAIARMFRRTRLYTNELMTENLAFYHKLGYLEYARQTVHGYRRVFLEKFLAAFCG
jgi:ribosomal protein S18 acetylase RimI-like enzyme